MAGIDKILEHINNEAETDVKKVIAEAQKEADDIIRRAKKQSESQLESLNAKTESEYKDKLKRGESAASLKEKRMILEAKQDIIQEIIEDAKESLYKLSDKEYFETLLKMAGKYSTGEKGKLLLNANDYKRKPSDFGKNIESAGLELSDETREIAGGFVLVYGDVEENCSFEALFLAAKEELQDKVGELLFG